MIWHPNDNNVYWHQSEQIRPRKKPCGFSFYWNHRMMESLAFYDSRLFGSRVALYYVNPAYNWRYVHFLIALNILLELQI